jgi:hypothetical protein
LGLIPQEIDRFMNLVELMKRSTHINLNMDGTAKKMLVMRFIEGPINRQIVLDPDQMPIVFGQKDPNQESGQGH